MRKVYLLSFLLICINTAFAQKERVFKVDGDMVTNSSGTFFQDAQYILQNANNSTITRRMSGNFNRDGANFFYVYTAPAFDKIIQTKDAEIDDLKKQLADLRTTTAQLVKDLRLIKTKLKLK